MGAGVLEGRSRVVKGIVRGALVAAAYVAVSYALAPISFGPLQFRVAEGLTLLPILFPEAVPGLFVGCLVTNLIGPYGLPDIVFGSLVTLVAAIITRVFRRSVVAYVSPIVLNAMFVSAYLTFLTGVPYWMLVLSIGASEAVSVLAIGVPLLRFMGLRWARGES
ncbi:MAG: QueT transporter family protein [Bacillota bacterium]|nr:QueT transporter family protein [Bacillota bacterium]